MNIVFFIGHLQHGGAESVVATLSSRLAQKGHKITIVSNLKNQFYAVSPEVNIVDVQSWQYDTFVGSFPVRVYKKIANRFLDLIRIRGVIKKEKPDVVISFLIAWLWQLLLICKGKTPIICAERNAMIYPHSRHNFLTKQVLYRLAYAVQVMSKHDKAWLRKRYKRVYAMPNPLRFEPMSRVEYEESFSSRDNILACGRVEPQKGYDKMILAFSKIAENYPTWRIDICGVIEDKKYYNYLVGLLKDNNLENRIYFIGPHKDVASIMKSHSVFCLSSKHEGFPNVLSEAMACGMACVSYDIVTGPSEIINDGLDGIIVEDSNVEALADGLSKVIEDKQLRYDLGIHSIENIKRYRQDRIVDKWEHFFDIIIKEYNKDKKF